MTIQEFDNSVLGYQKKIKELEARIKQWDYVNDETINSYRAEHLEMKKEIRQLKEELKVASKAIRGSEAENQRLREASTPIVKLLSEKGEISSDLIRDLQKALEGK